MVLFSLYLMDTDGIAAPVIDMGRRGVG